MVHHDVSQYLTIFITIVTNLLYCVVTARRNKKLITVVHHTKRSKVKRAVKCCERNLEYINWRDLYVEKLHEYENQYT